MRVSTANRYETAVDSLQRRQRDLADEQAAMTSGKRINKPSDDPTGAARAERAFISGQRIASEQRSVAASRSAMTLAESALGQAGDLMQTARETLVSAGNGSFSAADRQAQADQLSQLRSQLLSVANQGNGADGYLFGGQGATTAPFLDNPGGMQAATPGGETQLSTTDSLPISVDGPAIWLTAPSGNGVFVTCANTGNTGSGWIDAGTVTDPAAITGKAYTLSFQDNGGALSYSVQADGQPTALTNVPYTDGAPITVDGMSFQVKGGPVAGDGFTIDPSAPNLNVFGALDKAIATLKDPSANVGQVAQAVNSGLRDLDSVMGHMQAARAAAGSTLTRLDALDGRNQDRALWAKSVQSDAEDLDMVQAISNFQNQQTGYQAALQSYATVQKLSLFDYLK